MMNVAGLDIGFSLTRRSSGVATLVDGQVRLGCYKAGDAACAPIVEAKSFRVIAIDGPIIPEGGDPLVKREVESLFASGPFQNRCKPGFSHVPGTGKRLREAACAAADRLAAAAPRDETQAVLQPVRAGNVVETFPNAFLGVCLSDQSYGGMPRPLKRGKFDWLYDRWVEQGLVASLPLPDGSEQLRQLFASTKNHDERGALVCLLAALLVARGTFTAVGDEAGGWFFLPPSDVWQPWALKALEEGCKQRNGKGAKLRAEEGSAPPV